MKTFSLKPIILRPKKTYFGKIRTINQKIIKQNIKKKTFFKSYKCKLLFLKVFLPLLKVATSSLNNYGFQGFFSRCDL